MKLTRLSQIAPGNPFLSDPFNMGAIIGSNVTVMFGKHASERQTYLIVVDTETGERVEIQFPRSQQEAGEV